MHLKTLLVPDVKVIDTNEVAGMQLFVAISLKRAILGNGFARQSVPWSNGKRIWY